jgi:hypothetical protein
MSPAQRIEINRAPVLTLWAAVVAERLGHTREEALTLGKALAGMNAQSKAVHLGLRPRPTEQERAERRAKAPRDAVELLGRRIPVVETADGVRAASDGKPDSPKAVERYLESKFGEALAAARAAMTALAKRWPAAELAVHGFSLYERFRPTIPAGTRGWGAKGVLDLGVLESLAPPGKAKAKAKRGG